MKDQWDARYSGSDYVYGITPNRFFASAISSLAPGRLLLPGEGEGRNAVWAASKGWIVDAIDFSAVARAKALQLEQRFQVSLNSYIVSDLMKVVLPANCYDVAAEIFVHLPPPVRKHWHNKLIASLKPKGLLLLEAYHQSQLNFGTGGPQNPELLYTTQMLESDFAGFEMIRLEQLEESLSEGVLHQGLSSLVRMIARKRS